jgi:hypothetical protein
MVKRDNREKDRFDRGAGGLAGEVENGKMAAMVLFP